MSSIANSAVVQHIVHNYHTPLRMELLEATFLLGKILKKSRNFGTGLSGYKKNTIHVRQEKDEKTLLFEDIAILFVDFKGVLLKHIHIQDSYIFPTILDKNILKNSENTFFDAHTYILSRIFFQKEDMLLHNLLKQMEDVLHNTSDLNELFEVKGLLTNICFRTREHIEFERQIQPYI